ncbi:hypothetical protein BYT27DRAFT_7194602 [Phlegmacium glaucopus]|nr:hypothetical protein BYT27DRAFT_7194602 [Phlegmacium glaucopus]
MKDLVRQMTEVHEFSDLDPAGFQRLANKILASTTFRTNCNELLAAMADARRLLEDLDQLRPPVAVPSPVADVSPPGSPAITPAAEERDELMDDVDEEDDVEIVTPPTSPRGGESSKAQGKCPVTPPMVLCDNICTSLVPRNDDNCVPHQHQISQMKVVVVDDSQMILLELDCCFEVIALRAVQVSQPLVE